MPGLHKNTDLPEIKNPWGLTPPECEVLRLLGDGKDRPLAAQMMNGISPKTVDAHLLRLKKKMEADTTIQAVVLYDRHLRSAV